MVRITADLIDEAAQFTNACDEREIDLRDNKIQVIENMGTTRDLFDTVDFSNNDIRELDGFPLLRNLQTIIINNNRISRIGDTLAKTCPGITELVLTNNNITDFRELHKLKQFAGLTHISLVKNPISAKQHYRDFLIYACAKLRVIDFSKIKQKERAAVAAKFAGASGAALLESLLNAPKKQTVATGKRGGKPASMSGADVATSVKAHTAAQANKIKAAIAAASTLDEVKKIERELLAGAVPEVEMQA